MGGIVMNENLDLTKILNGCPIETEFYSSIFGKVLFMGIDKDNSIYPILVKVSFGTNALKRFTKQGKRYVIGGECTLFPDKNQRDWSKFKRFWDKQKEKFDLKTLKPFDKVLVRNDSLGSWRCDLLSHFNKFSGNPLFISTQYWHECIPYNKDTKYLLGTKCEAPEYYKWWEE